MTMAIAAEEAGVAGNRRRVHLTRREIEVLRAWLRHDSKEAAGRSLFIAASTVAVHVSRVRAKYAAAGRPAGTKVTLAVRMLQDGHLELEDLT